MVEITLPDGSKREFEGPVTVAQIAASIGAGLARAALAGRVDGKLVDLSETVDHDASVAIITGKDEEGLDIIRHSTAHLMAQAVKQLYPEAEVTIGPSIENGFYYDFSCKKPFSEEDLAKIEKRMDEIVAENLPITHREVTRDEAISFFDKLGEHYKVELVKAIPEDQKITLYTQGDFTDLCRGPHVPSTGVLKVHKLMKVAGAYWRGDSSKKMLQRIYGTAFPKKDELDQYLNMLEEAKKRDHRKLGKELGLFMLTEEGPGFPFFLPNGMILKNTLIDYWREVHKRYGYVEVSTPMILNRKLWERSGHWDHYKQNMYTTVIDDEDYAIKPMNCPGGMLVYKAQPHSYKELPLRVGELGLVHRHELSGALHGLFRVRCFTQDDAHIFMTWDQMKDEIKNVVRLFDEVYSTFGLTYQIELSTMPEDHMGDIKDWQFAEKTLAEAITEIGKDYVVNEGDGAFYGPKLDFHLADSIGRTWQCGTIQLDMQLPERFELEYTGADGEKHRPVMIHRVVLGSIERFIGVITEHFAGAFPTWLAPEQVRVMPMTDRNIPCAQEVMKQLTDKGFRATMDERNEKIGYKIREAQVHKVPYMIVIGDKDEEKGIISVRNRKTGETTPMKLGEFIEKLDYEVKNKLK